MPSRRQRRTNNASGRHPGSPLIEALMPPSSRSSSKQPTSRATSSSQNAAMRLDCHNARLLSADHTLRHRRRLCSLEPIASVSAASPQHQSRAGLVRPEGRSLSAARASPLVWPFQSHKRAVRTFGQPRPKLAFPASRWCRELAPGVWAEPGLAAPGFLAAPRCSSVQWRRVAELRKAVRRHQLSNCLEDEGWVVPEIASG